MNDGIRYSIISTPRSGTTYLCSLLQKTGRMGNPEEYFNDDLIPTYQEKLKLEGNPQSYLDKIIWQSRMKNDCVGVNINSKESFEVAKKNGWVDITTHWIRLTREDKILQSISLYKAWETNKWHSFQNSNKSNVSYSFTGIKRAYDYILFQEKFWDSMNIDYMDISYEKDLLEDCYTTIYCMLGYVNLPIEGMGKLTSDIKILRDESSFDWKEKFLKELNSK
jgi:LPS sulfotransferase NodH